MNGTEGEFGELTHLFRAVRLRSDCRFASATHEVTWLSIVSAMAICRQALPAQLEYPP